MQIKAVFPWRIMPGDKILHRTEGVVRVTSTRPDDPGSTYIVFINRYGLLETFRCGPFDRVLKLVDQGGLF